MDRFIFSLLLATFTVHPLPFLAQSTASPGSQITVEGSVYCDPCFNNGFSTYSYFMEGADVHIQCRVKANSPATAEIITFSVNRTTDGHGVFKLEIPHVDGVDCVEGPPIQFFCQASLLRSSSSACNIPALRTTTYQISVKSKQENLCIYSFPGMSFRPTARNESLCGKSSLNPTKVSLPHGFPWPRFPLPKAPSLPFPFLNPPPPPAFSLGDPRTWFPHNPFLSSPPPPPPPAMFNPWDPRTWPPLIPSPPTGPLKKKP